MFHYFFDWYTGGVWSNLLASVIWTVPVYAYGRYHFKKLHKKHNDIHQDIKRLMGEDNGNN